MDYEKKGKDCFNRECYAEAIKNLKKCRETGNKYEQIAQCYCKLDDYSSSLKYFNLAIQLEPKNIQFQYELGVCYNQFKHYNKAYTILYKIYKQWGEIVYVLRELATSMFYLRRYKEALVYIEKAVQANLQEQDDFPDFDTFLIYFQILNIFHEYEKVIAIEKKYKLLQYYKIKETLTNFCEFFLFYAWAFANKKNEKEMKDLCSSRLLSDCGNACNVAFAFYYYAQHQYEDAKRFIKKVAKNKKYYNYYFFIAKINKELKEEDEEINNYKKEIDMSKDYYEPSDVFIELANAYFIKGDYKNAYEILEEREIDIEDEHMPYELLLKIKKCEICFNWKEKSKVKIAKKEIMYIMNTLMNEEIRAKYLISDLIEIYSKFLELNQYYHEYMLQDLVVFPKNILGEGRYSKVYRGILNEEPVAVKFYNLEDDEGFTKNKLEDIFLEVCTMELLTEHKLQYILPIKCAFYLNNRKFIYLITPLCKGGSLYNLLYDEFQREITPQFRRAILQQITKGINELHSLNVVHLDLNPSNILFSEEYTKYGNNQIFICDFDQVQKGSGIKRVFSKYTAPEVIENKPYTEKVDIYSLGYIIWALYSRNEKFQEVPIEALMNEKNIDSRELEPIIRLIYSCIDPKQNERPTAKGVNLLIKNIMNIMK